MRPEPDRALKLYVDQDQFGHNIIAPTLLLRWPMVVPFPSWYGTIFMLMEHILTPPINVKVDRILVPNIRIWLWDVQLQSMR